MSSNMKVESSLNHAQRALFIRFVAVLISFLLIIELIIGAVLFYRLYTEENKLLASMATEYQRIIKFDTDKKFIHVVENNPQRLLDNNIAIFWQAKEVGIPIQFVAGKVWLQPLENIQQYQPQGKNWLTSILLAPYLSLKLPTAAGDYWMIVDIAADYPIVLRQWLSFLIALLILAFFSSVIVWRLINSTLSPLFTLANRLDLVSEGALDLFSKQMLPVTDKSESELSSINRSVSKVMSRLQNAMKNMDNTLDAVAHDLRTPLSRIQLAAEKGLLSQATGEARNRELFDALSDCAEGAEQASRMLTTLMKINDEQIGKRELTLETVNIAELLNTVAGWYEEIAEDKQIILKVLTDGDIVIQTEPNKLLQILVNLIDNAFKYTQQGGAITLAVKKNNRVDCYITVTDNGIGIEQEYQALIFKRLYRVDNSRNTPGYGLGLALSKAMIENLGGNIRVKSTFTLGSQFIITLNSQRRI
ncbi:MAG: HAMP domain-containing histidine kinase [Oceanospirillaceae bacterium]|nr:HAMP domain-containing histidine kinase [Oceanospirillaceae bacterium]